MSSYLFVAIWIVCGALGYARCFAYLQRNWPTLAEEEYYLDMGRACVYSLSGPLGLLAITMIGGFQHGLKWK